MTTEKNFCSPNVNWDHKLLITESCIEIGPVVVELLPSKEANKQSDKFLEIYKHVVLVLLLLLNQQRGCQESILIRLLKSTAYRPRNTRVDRKVKLNNFFLSWYRGCDVEISPRYCLKFSLKTQFFMCSSSERSVN